MGLFKLFSKQAKNEEENISVQETTEEVSTPEIPEDELIAVIAAAIQSSYEVTGKLFIRSYRRVEQNIPVWNRVARENLLNG